MADKDEIGLAFNRLLTVFSNNTTIEAFLERNKDHFTNGDPSYWVVSMSYFLSMIYAELVRNVLLFYTRKDRGQPFENKKMGLGKFFGKLKQISPGHAGLIESELEPFIRNSFAHGLFSIINENGELFLLCHESVEDLTRPTKLSLRELMEKRKKINIIYQTILAEITERIERGSFR